ncbi:hypothetical protein ACIBL3_35510 [Kribbella sp. NPDC050124]|uniref:hypothetical protein n=1 Tax=Kribbella sp. NPDC050124 TaxID=3364114 RepID=UPI00378BD91D
MANDEAQYLMPPTTPAQEAAQVLVGWMQRNPDPENEGGLKVSRDDPGVVIVYWRGAPPTGLRELAAQQPVPVIFFQAAYSQQELISAVRTLMDDNPDLISSGGPSPDCTGVGVTLWTTAPASALEKLQAASGVPIVFRGFVDPRPLAGAT